MTIQPTNKGQVGESFNVYDH